MLSAMPRAGPIAEGNVELVDDPARLRELAEGWRELALLRENAFLSPEWFWAWVRHYGVGQDLAVAVVWASDGTLEGLLPLVVGAGPRTARFAGSSLGDHFHPIASEDAEESVAAAIGRILGALPRPKPALLLENVELEAPWWRALARSSRYGPRPLVHRRAILPRIRFAGRTWEEYLASRSRNLRSQLGRKRRALERDHDVCFRWSEPDSVARDMATLFRLHDRRWAGRARESSLTSPRARAFHADFAAAATERGWLRLCSMEVDGATVAAWYGWRLGGRFAYYQAGFDPAWARRSVGLLLFAETIREAVREGAEEYDMLLGAEQFKLRFADSHRIVCTAFIAPRFRAARLAAAAEIGARYAAQRVPLKLRDAPGPLTQRVLERLPLSRRR